MIDKGLKFEEFSTLFTVVFHMVLIVKSNLILLEGTVFRVNLFLHFVFVSASSLLVIKIFPPVFYGAIGYYQSLVIFYPCSHENVTVTINYLSPYSKQDEIVKWLLLDLVY